MSNLPKGQCYTGYLFARMDAGGNYHICCGSVPEGGSYKEDGRFYQWMMRISYNLCIDHFKVK